MPNAASLVETTATALVLPPATVRQHMRNLREADEIAVGGRGITARDMTLSDAAVLFSAIAGSLQVSDSAETARAMRGLGPARMAQRSWSGNERSNVNWAAYIQLARGSDLLADVTSLFKFFCQEAALRSHLSEQGIRLRDELYATIEIENPVSFATMTIGIRSAFARTWTYGSRRECGLRQTRHCSEKELRKIVVKFPKLGFFE